MATRPPYDPYKAPPPPRTGPPVPNMGGFPPPLASQPRTFAAPVPMMGGVRPGPAPAPAKMAGTVKPSTGGIVPQQWINQALQGFGQPGGGGAGAPTAPTPTNTGPLPPAQAPTVPTPPLGQDPTQGHFPVPLAGQPQQSANAAVAAANAATPAPATTAPAKTGGGGGGPVIPAQEQNASNQILSWLNNMISGKGGAYNPAVMGSMKSDLLRATTGREKVAEDAINADAVARGLYRSGVAGRNIATAQRGSAADYSAGVRDLLEKKAASDTQTRVQALGMKQQWLNSLRDAGFKRAQMALAGRGGPAPEMITITNPDGTTQQITKAQADYNLALLGMEANG